MRILCCLNRDLASNVALNLLLPTFAQHEVRVVLTEKVGTPASHEEPTGRKELRLAEQQLPNETLFPLIERAAFADDGQRYLTFGEIARHRDIRVEALPDPNTDTALTMISAFAPDLIVTIRYGGILRAPVIATPRLGVLNLHSGVLPAYRGVLATFRALANGDPEIGCTLHYIQDATIDTGDIVAIARIRTDRRRSLLWHILALYPSGIELIRAAVDQLAEGQAPRRVPQPPGEGRYYSWPTADEWDAFSRLGWRVTDLNDLAGLLQRHVPANGTASSGLPPFAG